MNRFWGLVFIFSSQPWFANAGQTVNGTRPVDLPAGCFGKQFPCAIHHQASGTWQWNHRNFSVSANTSLVLLNEKTIQLMNGDLWSEDFKDLDVKHGIFQLKLSGDLMLNRRDHKLQVVNLNGLASLDKSGIKAEIIPAGFSNWYEGLGQGGEFRQGVLSPWTAKDIALLFRKIPDQSEVIKSKLSNYRGHRKQALTESSNLYFKVAELRRLASESESARRENRLQQQRQENTRLRQMYRDKFYNP